MGHLCSLNSTVCSRDLWRVLRPQPRQPKSIPSLDLSEFVHDWQIFTHDVMS